MHPHAMASLLRRAGCRRCRRRLPPFLRSSSSSLGTRDPLLLLLRARATTTTTFPKSPDDGRRDCVGLGGGTRKRCLSSSGKGRRGGGGGGVVSSENPFEVLGVPNTATYAEAKTAFLELAMRHHPDTATDDDDDDDADGEKRGMETFVRYRQAFERIRETEAGGSAVVDADGSSSSSAQEWTDEEFIAWYHEEKDRHSGTGVRLDMKTRREVIDVVNRQAQGGLDRGGIWEWARRLAEEDKMLRESKKNFKRSVGISANSTTTTTTTSNLRRRRRKK